MIVCSPTGTWCDEAIQFMDDLAEKHAQNLADDNDEGEQKERIKRWTLQKTLASNITKRICTKYGQSPGSYLLSPTVGDYRDSQF